MLEKFILVNFQKHAKQEVEFSPTVTTLVGNTDAGKSAILRALRFLMLAKLAGNPDEYIRWGTTGMRLTLWVDGRRVTRIRSKHKNVYLLDGTQFKFDSVNRKEVPGEIATLLNVSHNNFQRQLDPQFWLTESAGQIAKNLNEIVNLQVIDSSLANVTSALRKARAEYTVAVDRRRDAEAKKKQTAWVKQADAEYRLVEKLERVRVTTAEKAASLGEMVRRGSNLTHTRKSLKDAALGGLNAVSAFTRLRVASGKADNLRKLVAGAERAGKLISTIVPDINPLLSLRKKADTAAEERRFIEGLITDAQEGRKLWRLKESELTRALAQLRELSRSKKICPTCGQVLKSSPSS